jgi:putative FmdB family regulatory protein
MPTYPFKCPDCGHYEEQIFTIASRPDSIPCPCGGKATRRIGVSSADCFSERPAWIASVGDIVNPNGSHAEREFYVNRTRENYSRFLREKGLRHVEPGERLGKHTKPVDLGKITREVYERQRERKKIHL